MIAFDSPASQKRRWHVVFRNPRMEFQKRQTVEATGVLNAIYEATANLSHRYNPNDFEILSVTSSPEVIS